MLLLKKDYHGICLIAEKLALWFAELHNIGQFHCCCVLEKTLFCILDELVPRAMAGNLSHSHQKRYLSLGCVLTAPHESGERSCCLPWTNLILPVLIT